ncbi:MAG: ubiquinol-cytochrome C chaperone family protein [Sphingomonadaceae bacterium]
MSYLSEILGGGRESTPHRRLYGAALAIARDPAWYREGGVADTLDGRFDMLAAMLSLIIMRLENMGDEGKGDAARLTEAFVEDMDAQLRQMGVGDLVVGKKVAKMVSALGGRLGAYREALEGEGELEEALLRNLYRGDSPPPEALAWTARGLRARHQGLAVMPRAALLEGRLDR